MHDRIVLATDREMMITLAMHRGGRHDVGNAKGAVEQAGEMIHADLGRPHGRGFIVTAIHESFKSS